MCRQLTKIPLQSTTMECRDIKPQRKHKKSERGSITLEAAVFLTLFILFYVAMMDLIQIAKAQVLLQYSINEAAKKISVYSYVLTKAGITGKHQETSKQAVPIQNVFTSLTKLGDVLPVGDVSDVVGAVGGVADAIQDIDTGELPDDIVSWIKAAAFGKFDEIALGEVVKSEVKRQIDMMSTKGADRFLQDLGIDDGLEGLGFEGSSWASEEVDGLPVLTVKVTYTIDFHLGYLELQPRTYTLCAKTAVW